MLVDVGGIQSWEPADGKNTHLPRLGKEVRQVRDVHQNQTWIFLACMCYHYYDVNQVVCGGCSQKGKKGKDVYEYSKSDLAYTISLFCYGEE